ncbi:MAG: substrate-binding domain-containing protein [Actinomycetes bacterium]|jgi:phosphate transport system substrate-binding protein|nr:substrate-binding domain-containing protein [Actinomycetes bacterium]
MNVSKRTRAFLVTSVLALSLLTSAVAFAAPAKKITVKVDKITVATDVKPLTSGKTALISLKTIANGLGATTSWSAKTKKATIQTTAVKLVFTVNGKTKTYTVNGVKKSLATPARLSGKKAMIPADALSKGLGGSAKLSGKTLTIKYFSGLGNLKVTGSSTLGPVMQSAAKKTNGFGGTKVTVGISDSGAGIKDTMQGLNNLGMSSRKLEPAKGEKGLKAYSVALDGIALIVNPKLTGVSGLTEAQARDIFLGKITNWRTVGGPNKAIKVYTRETGSGTRSSLQDLLLGKAADGSKNDVVRSATISKSSTLIKQAVAKNTYAIGYDSIGFVDKTVKTLSLNKIKPSKSTVKSGKYLLSRSLFLVTKGKAVGKKARLIDYLKTAYAQSNHVSKTGYIAIR